MNKNKLYRRILATALSVVMVLGLLPISAAAGTAPTVSSLTVTFDDGTTATAENNNALTCTKGKVVKSIVAQMDESVTVAANTIVTMQATGDNDECAQEMGTGSNNYGTIAVDAADSSKLIITPDGLNANAAYLGEMTFTVAAGAITDKNDPSAANTKITFKLTVTEDTTAPILKSLTVTYTDGTTATADNNNMLTCAKGKVVQSIVAQMDESVTVAANTIVTMQATGNNDECAQEMGTGSHDYGTIAVDAADSSKLIITPDGLNANAAYLGEMTFTVAAGAITDLSNNSNADAITFKLTVTEDSAATVWDGISTDTDWYNDTDTEFTITTAEQLAGLAELVNNGNTFSGKTVKLANDIVLNDVSNADNWDEETLGLNNWTAIGKDKAPFSGIFDGNGHTVSGIYIHVDNYVQGLFGRVQNGTVQNLGVTKSYICGSAVIGGIVAVCFGGTISKCYNEGTVRSTGKSMNGSEVGGIAGCITSFGNNTVVENCYNTGNVIGNDIFIGGIVGNPINSSSVVNCYNTGTLNYGSSTFYIGGIVGNSL